MKIKKINNIKIKPIKCDKLEQPIKGCELFPEIYGLYGNIFLVAKKRSGKSTVIYNILKKCAGKNTKIYIFCSTVNRDNAYEKIMDYLDNKNIFYESYTSIIDDKINNLDEILNELKNGADGKEEEEENEEEQKPKIKGIFEYEDDEIKKTEKKRIYKPKYVAPEAIFVFDDCGSSLLHRSIENLLKTNRHYKCKVILSSQYLNDLKPASRLNLDFVLIFKGMPLEKLQQIHKDIDVSIEFDKFVEMYEKATEQKFNFLYVDTRMEKYRINFNQEIEIENE